MSTCSPCITFYYINLSPFVSYILYQPVPSGVSPAAGFSKRPQTPAPPNLVYLQLSALAPIDISLARIGSGMATFSRHGKVMEPDGLAMRVGVALALINQTLDEAMAERERDFDAETRWAVTWFDLFECKKNGFSIASGATMSLILLKNETFRRPGLSLKKG